MNKKPLKRVVTEELHYYITGIKKMGPNPLLKGDTCYLKGNCTTIYGKNGAYGDCSKITGDISGLEGDVSGLEGDVSGLRGNAGDLYGDCTDLKGDLDRIPLDDRHCNINLCVDEDDYYLKMMQLIHESPLFQ